MNGSKKLQQLLDVYKRQPQNLYLYTISGLSIGAFVRIILPYSFVSAILLLIFILFLPKDTVSTTTAANTANSTNTVTASNTSNVICEAVKARKNPRILFTAYLILFLLCLLTVLHILPYQIMFLLVLTGFLLDVYKRQTIQTNTVSFSTFLES